MLVVERAFVGFRPSRHQTLKELNLARQSRGTAHICHKCKKLGRNRVDEEVELFVSTWCGAPWVHMCAS